MRRAVAQEQCRRAKSARRSERKIHIYLRARGPRDCPDCCTVWPRHGAPPASAFVFHVPARLGLAFHLKVALEACICVCRCVCVCGCVGVSRCRRRPVLAPAARAVPRATGQDKPFIIARRMEGLRGGEGGAGGGGNGDSDTTATRRRITVTSVSTGQKPAGPLHQPTDPAHLLWCILSRASTAAQVESSAGPVVTRQPKGSRHGPLQRRKLCARQETWRMQGRASS